MTQEAGTPPNFWERVEQVAERVVARAMRSGASRNMSIGEGGKFTIKGGKLRVMYPEDEGGGLGVYFGGIQQVGGGAYLGTGYMVQGPDGRDILMARSDAATGGSQIILRDSEGNPVLYTNAGGEGLSRPFIFGGFMPTRYADWTVQTTSATFETLFTGNFYKQHPKLFVRTRSSTSASGTTGEIRVLVDGVQLGNVSARGFSTGADDFGPAAIDGANMDWKTIEVQGRVTSGTGALRMGGALWFSRGD